jgi:hypothetical protein
MEGQKIRFLELRNICMSSFLPQSWSAGKPHGDSTLVHQRAGQDKLCSGSHRVTKAIGSEGGKFLSPWFFSGSSRTTHKSDNLVTSCWLMTELKQFLY